jgi:rhodanese-related sulfurtransferase
MSLVDTTQTELPQTVRPILKQISRVLEVAPAPSAAALEHFEKRLTFETDCADVYASQVSDRVDFILVDVRGRELYKKGHVPGAINIPVLTITKERLEEYPQETAFVVYCAGPHCNGANKAAIRLAGMGRPVKEMIGGATGWIDDGFNLIEG